MITPARQPDALLGWMESLADPTRLRLLRLVERHELGVAELCDVLQLPQSTVSRHLKVLGDQGWTRSRRNGTANLYHMIDDALQSPARKLWQLARDEVADSPTFKQDQLRLTRLLSQRRKGSQAFFAGAAARWDKLRVELYGRAFNQAALLALLPADLVVADLGCGTGQVTAELAPYVGKVIGIDNSGAMLKAARRRTGEIKNVELRKGDLEALPLDDATCDAALLTLVLTYVDEPATVLGEAARIVKPGGRVVVVDLLRHGRDDFRRQMGQRCLGFEPETMVAMLRRAGCSAPTCRPLPPEAKAKGPALLLATGGKPESS